MRRVLDQTQKQYDHLQARYAGQAKSKEPSSLREDAFQLHEARKAYLKASLDFCIHSPQLKINLEKLMVRVCFGQWREFKLDRESKAATYAKHGREMERIHGWTLEMEISEKSSRREITSARKQIEEAAEQAVRPSRELEDYSVSTVPYLGSQAPTSLKLVQDCVFKPEKQGWLNLRTLTGKPTRTVWVRRWAFLKNGIFGCLAQGSRTGGVEESERIGVLLCSIRAAFQEERRFCFEVKTKNSTILLQAETQKELTEWIGSFESAKRKALESPSHELPPHSIQPSQDPAFSISQPPAPEFTADVSDSLTPNAHDEHLGADRSSTLPVGDREGVNGRVSGDFTNLRRSTAVERDQDGGRELLTPRIMQKLDLHRKSNSPSQQPSSSSVQPYSSGVAGMLSPNHNLFPPGTALPNNNAENEPDKSKAAGGTYSSRDFLLNTLAPPTLANPPTPTSMSRAAVIVSCERGIGIGVADSTGIIPSGMMANLWGTSHWGLINKLERIESSPTVCSPSCFDYDPVLTDSQAL